MFLAMYYIGGSDKPADAGGSYGFGKSALERASRTHSVIAHTAFEPVDDDPVTSRLIGFTWWPSLQVGDKMFDGRGNFSDQHASGPGQERLITPFEDEQANSIAQALGVQLRDAGRLEELGTSFLVVDTAIDPSELLLEVEKWWWPALEDNKVIEVVLPDGEVRTPKPLDNKFVARFEHPYRIAVGLEQPTDPNTERLASKSLARQERIRRSRPWSTRTSRPRRTCR